MKKPLLLLLLLIAYFQTQAQRTIPYPIIFVHGWIGSDKTWYGMGVMLQSQGLNVSLDTDNKRGGRGSVINFHLNADDTRFSSILNRSGGPYYYGDVYDYNSFINPNNDVFFVNFDNQFSGELSKLSNEAGITKQGFAVGLAVKKVLEATGAKKVILFGHSMGGLAIREYLQNPVNWLMNDGNHHVAKLITSGTPHKGSNSTFGNLLSLTGKQEASEAVRDLRHPKNTTLSEVDRGVFLFGGDERNIFRLGTPYFNDDVDCNGSLNPVKGLNQKSLYLDLNYSCIIGIDEPIPSPLGSGSDGNGDGVVEGSRASIFNLGYSNLYGDTFYASAKSSEATAKEYYTNDDLLWHTKLTKQRFINLYALDEPNESTYDVEVGKSYIGFFTPRPNDSKNTAFTNRWDVDYYSLNIPQSGLLTVNFSTPTTSGGFLEVYRRGSDKSILTLSWASASTKQILIESGEYRFVIYGGTGESNSFYEFKKYTFSTSICPMPSGMDVLAGSNNTFCEGGSVTLTATAGFDQYKWYKDDREINATSNQIVATQAGTYRAQGFKCGITVQSANFVNVNVIATPSKPTITMQEQPDKFVLTSSSPDGNQWYLNNSLINGATLKTHVPDQFGAYSVKVTQNGCSNQSDGLNVKMDKPTISYTGSTTFFEGDSLVLVAPAGYSGYQWTLNEAPLSTTMKHAARKSGNYRVSVQRGKLSSDFSDPINVIVNPILSISPNSDFILKLYPNPNKGTFWVELPDNISHWQIEVFDISGKRISEKSHKVGKYEQVELKSMPGTYFLKLSTEAKSKTVKFLIE